MASPQPTDSHTRLSNELYSQILMRDFSKRQRAILDLIIRLSYGCGKKSAVIPMAKYFEVCGVQANKVRRELETLRELRVIEWSTQHGRYWLNKDYDTWRIKPPPEHTKQMFVELLRTNIADQNGHDQNGQDDQNGPQDMTKTVHENGPKRSIESPENPDVARADGVPITKDNYIDKKTVIREIEGRPLDKYMLELMKGGNQIFQPYGISQNTAYAMAELLTKEMLPVELGIEALAVAKSLGNDEGFSRNKLRRWLQVGVKDAESARRYEEEVFSTKRQIAITGGERSEYPRRSGTSGTDSPPARKRIVDTPGAY